MHRGKKRYEDKPKNYIGEEELGVKLTMWYFEQCDPKKCSGMILKSRGLITTLSKSAKFNGIVLTPNGKKIVSKEDAEIIEKNGIAVIDCSWALFDQVKVKSIKAHERQLPLCKASNPVNYGKDYKLNCAEAFAGALWLGGFKEAAEKVLYNFKYGPAFLAINEFHFNEYDKCETSDEMFKAQEKVKNALEQEREENRNREIDYGPGSSDEDEDDDSDDSEAERAYYAEINRKIAEKEAKEAGQEPEEKEDDDGNEAESGLKESDQQLQEQKDDSETKPKATTLEKSLEEGKEESKEEEKN